MSGHFAIFYRDGKEQFRQVLEKKERHWRVRHHQLVSTWYKVETFTPECMTDVVEVYELNETFNCPNCQCLIYNSINFRELPEFVFEQEREAEVQRKRRYRFDAEYHNLINH